jgi:hypothetical protein
MSRETLFSFRTSRSLRLRGSLKKKSQLIYTRGSPNHRFNPACFAAYKPIISNSPEIPQS